MGANPLFGRRARSWQLRLNYFAQSQTAWLGPIWIFKSK